MYNKKATRPRVYVCHTFYHVYVSYLKELNLPVSERGRADIVLSTMSTQFDELPSRIAASKIFDKVIMFDEHRENTFPELDKYKINRGNALLNLMPRILYTRKLAKLEAQYIPCDFRDYKDIYVFCDSDPIGYYLSQSHIYYHAVEDGLDVMMEYTEAIYDNRGSFNLKRFLSEKLNLIFIHQGFNKYCLDMEINDLSLPKYKYDKLIGQSREQLAANLSKDDCNLLIRVFVANIDELNNQIETFSSNNDYILLLTETVCALPVRLRIFKDLVERYSKEGTVFIKPHPRDDLDYVANFPGCMVFDRKIPMEIFNLFPNMRFKKAVTITTPLGEIKFADTSERLGNEFLDPYEDPFIHQRAKRFEEEIQHLDSKKN